MVQISNQYDTTNAWFTICSVGAVFSLVFSIMGIKWWFRKRITFDHDPSVESIARPGRSNQSISVATTGIYRQSKDVDSFDVLERPKSLPPVKVRPSSGQPFMPVRHTFIEKNDASEGQRPVPEEIIPIPEDRIPKSPPSTPITAVRDDFSKPVVIDIDIPGESGYILQTDNELPKPETHQTLTLNEGSVSQPTVEIRKEVIVPKPRTRKKISVTETPTPEVNTPVFETVVKKSNNQDKSTPETDDTHMGSSEILASSEKLNEFEAFIEQERKEMESMKASKIETHENVPPYVESIDIIEPPKVMDELVKQPPLVIEETVQINNEESETKEANQLTNGTNMTEFQPEVETVEPKNDTPSESVTIVGETLKNPHLNFNEPLDVSKIVSPKPRMRKGILKKRAPPVPVETEVETTTVEKEKEVEKEEENVILRWVDPSNEITPEETLTETNETIIKKEVKFDSNEPDIIERPESIITIGNLIEYFNEQDVNVSDENTITEKVEETVKTQRTLIKLDEKLLESESVEQTNEESHTQLKEIENIKEETVKIPQNIIIFDPEFESVEQETDTDTIEILSAMKVVEKDVSVVEITEEKREDPVNDSVKIVKTSEMSEQVKSEMLINPVEPETVDKDTTVVVKEVLKEPLQADLISGEVLIEEQQKLESEVKKEKNIVEEDIVEGQKHVKETKEISVSSKEPVPTPRKLLKSNEETQEVDIKDKEVVQQPLQWEPQTIVHNDQTMVITPPPNYPPPMLSNSYLSDDSDESGTSEEYDENNPPKPPKRYRIYVVNSESGDSTTKVKPILKTRPPQKRVSFDNASPDIYLRTPDMPSSDNTDTESLKSPLMPNFMMNELSPKIRSVGFDLVKDEEVEMVKQVEVDSDIKINQESEEILDKAQVPEKPQTLPETPETKPEPQEVIQTSSINLLDLDDSPSKILDIQSPLDDKIAIFKSLAEKLNDSPVKSPDRQFEELLTPEPVQNNIKINGNVPKNESPTNKTIDKEPSQTPIPRPTSLLLNDTKKIDKRNKPPRRQISEPAISPRDALLEEIRSFGNKKKLIKRENMKDTVSDTTDTSLETPKRDTIKVDVEEALI